MTREFNVVIERDEDGYFVASVPELRGCHTQAKSLDVLMKRVKEAMRLCLEVEEGKPAGVLLCRGDYDELVINKDFLDSVGRGISDAESGNVYRTKELKAALSERRRM